EREAEAAHASGTTPVCKEPRRERGISREPRNCSAPRQGERTREHGNKRGEERKDETSHDRVSARAETIDRAPCRVRVKANESAVDSPDHTKIASRGGGRRRRHCPSG